MPVSRPISEETNVRLNLTPVKIKQEAQEHIAESQKNAQRIMSQTMDFFVEHINNPELRERVENSEIFSIVNSPNRWEEAKIVNQGNRRVVSIRAEWGGQETVLTLSIGPNSIDMVLYHNGDIAEQISQSGGNMTVQV